MTRLKDNLEAQATADKLTGEPPIRCSIPFCGRLSMRCGGTGFGMFYLQLIIKLVLRSMIIPRYPLSRLRCSSPMSRRQNEPPRVDRRLQLL